MPRRRQDATRDRQARMRAMVVEHARFVLRALRKAGVPRWELDDEMQRTFIVAAGRLEDVPREAERSFLFRVARNNASHMRRSLARRRELPGDQVPEQLDTLAAPDELLDRMWTSRRLEAILASVKEPLRAVFVLYEVEELDTYEIAVLLGIPRGTVASRLRRARAQLRQNAAAIELAWEAGIEDATPLQEPDLLRNGSMTPIERALLGAGARMPASASARAGTMAALGLTRPSFRSDG